MKSLFYIFMMVLVASCKNNLQDNVRVQKNNPMVSKTDTIIKTSKPFKINKIESYWKYSITCGGDIMMQLKENTTNRILLVHSDITPFEFDFYKNKDYVNEQYTENFKDVNFDGNIDFVIYSKQNSGSGGSFFDVYLFDHKTKMFERSEELSGGEIEIDTTKRTVSTYWKSGIALNSSQVRHFDKNGKIKFRETITQEVIAGDSISLLKTTYEKVVNGKIIKTEIDTTKFEGY